MKVLYYIHNSSHVEGSYISLITMVEYMKHKGIEVAIAANRDLMSSVAFHDFCQSYKIPIYYLQIYLSVNKKPVGLQGNLLYIIWVLLALRHKWKCAVALNRVVKKERPDIIHTNTGVLHEGFWVAKINAIPHVWHLREYQDLDFCRSIYPTKRFFEMLLKRSESVIALTCDIRRHFDLSESCIAHVVYNGVCFRDDLQLIMPKKKYFLIASRISEEKGISEIIYEFIKFHKNNKKYDLLIAGEISELNKSIVDKFKDTEYIKFLGWKNKKELRTLMSNATALIVNSRYEGFGRMTAEAICNGCLVIGKNCGGTKEIIEKTNGGWGYNDYDEFYGCMENVINIDEHSYNEKVLKSQHIAKSLFSIESYGDAVLNIYRKLLKSDRD